MNTGSPLLATVLTSEFSRILVAVDDSALLSIPIIDAVLVVSKIVDIAEIYFCLCLFV